MAYSLSNPMFDHLLESSHQDDSNKWSNIGFGEEITQVELIEVNFTHFIWGSGWVNHSNLFIFQLLIFVNPYLHNIFIKGILHNSMNHFLFSDEIFSKNCLKLR